MGGLQNLTEKRLRRFLTLSLALFMGASLFYVCFRYVLPWCLPFLLALLVAALLEPVVLYLRRKFHFQRGFSALILTLTLLFLLGGLLSLLWSTLLSQTNALLAAAPAFFDAIPAAADDLLLIGAVQRVESRMAQRLSARAAFQGRHGCGQPAALAVFARDGVARLCRRGAAGRRARHRDGRACDLLHLRVVPRALRGTRTRRAGRSDGKAAALSRRRNALACAVAARAGNAVAHHVFRASYRLSPHAPELFPAARLSHHTARRAAGLRHGHGARAVGGLHAAVRLPAQGHRAPRALPLHAHHAQHA